MAYHRIAALVVRHLYLYRRSLPRMMEIVYWPFLDLVIWGFITMYLARFQGQMPAVVTFLLGALILWDVLFRSQQGITISFLEEIWARNLMNLFASPLTPSEFLAATMVMSLFKVTAVSIVMSGCAWLFYGYNVFIVGLWLIPFVMNLVLTGWIIGVFTTSLIMRFGVTLPPLLSSRPPGCAIRTGWDHGAPVRSPLVQRLAVDRKDIGSRAVWGATDQSQPSS